MEVEVCIIILSSSIKGRLLALEQRELWCFVLFRMREADKHHSCLQRHHVIGGRCKHTLAAAGSDCCFGICCPKL